MIYQERKKSSNKEKEPVCAFMSVVWGCGITWRKVSKWVNILHQKINTETKNVGSIYIKKWKV